MRGPEFEYDTERLDEKCLFLRFKVLSYSSSPCLPLVVVNHTFWRKLAVYPRHVRANTNELLILDEENSGVKPIIGA